MAKTKKERKERKKKNLLIHVNTKLFEYQIP